jgi:hypothetical protein
VGGQGTSRQSAENAALNNLARAFKTDVDSLTTAEKQFSEIAAEAAGKKGAIFTGRKNYFEQVSTASSVKGLIGVETGTFLSANGETWYAHARMNRGECAARYETYIRENTAIINELLRLAGAGGTSLEAYAALYYAAAIAQVTDNFQKILEVLDPAAVDRRPGYGGAAAIRTRMTALAGNITLGMQVEVEAGDRQESATILRAFGAFYNNLGFKVNEGGTGNYILSAHVLFETVDTTKFKTCRWFLDAALKDRRGTALFSYTVEDRAVHLEDKEARRLALRNVETSIKEGDFAGSFSAWLGSLLE